LAFVFGYSLTLFAVLRAGLSLKAAVKVALAADTVSIAVMELVDNGIIALTPGAMDAGLSDGLFWSALLGGFVVAFLVTTPVNKWMMGGGKGHAVFHAHHCPGPPPAPPAVTRRVASVRRPGPRPGRGGRPARGSRTAAWRGCGSRTS